MVWSDRCHTGWNLFWYCFYIEAPIKVGAESKCCNFVIHGGVNPRSLSQTVLKVSSLTLLNASKQLSVPRIWSVIRWICILLVLYFSLSTFSFRGRKNEYSAQRGWRRLAVKSVSEKSTLYKSAQKWIWELRQIMNSDNALYYSWGCTRVSLRSTTLLRRNKNCPLIKRVGCLSTREANSSQALLQLYEQLRGHGGARGGSSPPYSNLGTPWESHRTVEIYMKGGYLG